MERERERQIRCEEENKERRRDRRCVKMCRRGHAKMLRCEDVKMYNRPPPLEDAKGTTITVTMKI